MVKEEPRAGTSAQVAGAQNIFGQLRDLTTDALRYWELRRLFYNVLLAAIVAGLFSALLPPPESFPRVYGGFCLLLLAPSTHTAGLAAFVVDPIHSLSGIRS